MISKNLCSRKKGRKEKVLKEVLDKNRQSSSKTKHRNLTAYIGAYIPHNLYMAIKAIAESDERTVAQLVRKALKEVVNSKSLANRVGEGEVKTPKPKAVTGAGHRF